MVKQLKNRYNDAASNRKFLVGINRAKMKLFDSEDSTALTQSNQTESKRNGSGFDGSNFDDKFASKSKENDFANWNI